MHRPRPISADDQAAIRAIAGRYAPAAVLERVSSFNNIVVRFRQPDGRDKVLKLARGSHSAPGMCREPQVMALLRQNGIPVPSVEVEDVAGKLVGRPFFIMTCAGDRTASQLNGLSGHNRRHLARDLGKTLARIHNILFNAPADFTGHRLVKPRFERSPVEVWHRAQLAYARQHRLFDEQLLESVEAQSQIMPVSREFGICHGDFNPAQCVRAGPRVSAVLDWEASYVGDPVYDYALFDVVLESALTPMLAAECRLAYAEVRPLPQGYHEAYRGFKVAHAIALAGTWHAARRGGSLRSTQALVHRLAADPRVAA